jgi:bifunctional non-homologous end joining protein LigD
MARIQNLPKRVQPMLATLTDKPFDDKGWMFEDKYDGFRMIAVTKSGKVTLYSRNGKIISHNYIEVARVLEGVEGDAVIDGELVALDTNGTRIFSSCKMRFAARQSCNIARSTLCSLIAWIFGIVRSPSAKSA